jgi:hypothetical protein
MGQALGVLFVPLFDPVGHLLPDGDEVNPHYA